MLSNLDQELFDLIDEALADWKTTWLPLDREDTPCLECLES